MGVRHYVTIPNLLQEGLQSRALEAVLPLSNPLSMPLFSTVPGPQAALLQLGVLFDRTAFGAASLAMKGFPVDWNTLI